MTRIPLKTLSIRLPDELYDTLVSKAAEAELSSSAFGRNVLEKYFSGEYARPVIDLEPVEKLIKTALQDRMTDFDNRVSDLVRELDLQSQEKAILIEKVQELLKLLEGLKNMKNWRGPV